MLTTNMNLLRIRQIWIMKHLHFFITYDFGAKWLRSSAYKINIVATNCSYLRHWIKILNMMEILQI